MPAVPPKCGMRDGRNPPEPHAPTPTQMLPGHASKAALQVRSHWHGWSLNKVLQQEQNKMSLNDSRGEAVTPLFGHTGTEPAARAALHPTAC